MYGQPVWMFEAEEFMVYDIEHLFGADLILARKVPGGHTIPTAIMSHQQPLDFFQKRWATKWCLSADRQDYAAVGKMMRTLGEDLR